MHCSSFNSLPSLVIVLLFLRLSRYITRLYFTIIVKLKRFILFFYSQRYEEINARSALYFKDRFTVARMLTEDYSWLDAIVEDNRYVRR